MPCEAARVLIPEQNRLPVQNTFPPAYICLPRRETGNVRLLASDLISFYRPSECGLRVYLRHKAVKEAEPGPYVEILRRLGERHERQHLATLGSVHDLSGMKEDERLAATRDAVRAAKPVIYQAALAITTILNGTKVTIVGYPDFLLLDAGDYIIRDSKMSRRINDKDHPEILLQVQLYGWLYEQTFGRPPRLLQIHSGTGDIVEVSYDRGQQAFDRLTEILELKLLGTQPYEPVGASKCDGCGFEKRCWDTAIRLKDTSTVFELDQGLARALHQDGLNTRAELLAKFDETALAEYKRPYGNRIQKVGKKAGRILLNAEIMESGQERVLAAPQIPISANYVMFDLEGMPPQLDELDKIYLWGIQAFGDKPSDFMPAVAGFGENGDREGWEQFLRKAKEILDTYGDLPFVHWSPYERTYVNRYLQRYGDSEGVAARVTRNLFDLHPITKESIALPIPGYGLKLVEQYVGFTRTQEEYGGDWAMATFIEATETEDETKRRRLLKAILKYNKEDLEATWTVLQWLKSKSPPVRA